MNPDTQPIDCDGCGEPCEAWPAGGGYGHNGAPFFDGRVCANCNESVVMGRILLASGKVDFPQAFIIVLMSMLVDDDDDEVSA